MVYLKYCQAVLYLYWWCSREFLKCQQKWGILGHSCIFSQTTDVFTTWWYSDVSKVVYTKFCMYYLLLLKWSRLRILSNGVHSAEQDQQSSSVECHVTLQFCGYWWLCDFCTYPALPVFILYLKSKFPTSVQNVSSMGKRVLLFLWKQTEQFWCTMAANSRLEGSAVRVELGQL